MAKRGRAGSRNGRRVSAGRAGNVSPAIRRRAKEKVDGIVGAEWLTAMREWLNSQRETLEERDPGAETTRIPTAGPESRIGAAMYLAALAYPCDETSVKDAPGSCILRRDKFIEAVGLWLDGEITSPEIRKETQARLKRCFDRILDRRQIAATHAESMSCGHTLNAELLALMGGGA